MLSFFIIKYYYKISLKKGGGGGNQRSRFDPFQKWIDPRREIRVLLHLQNSLLNLNPSNFQIFNSIPFAFNKF